MANFPSQTNDYLGPDFWQRRYQEGTTRWDLGRPAPPFVDWLDQPDAPSSGRLLVPGCGRGYDAILFAQRGFEVTAVDFAEGAMTATKTLAASRAVSVQLIQRNIFDLTPDFNQHFDYVVEHTCFCALAPHLRSAYVDLMAALLQPAGHFLGIFFTHQRPGGPPYGITPAEVRLLFEPNFDILSLQPVANSVPSRAGEEHLGWFQLQDS